MSTYTGRHRATVSRYRRALFAVTLRLHTWLALVAPTIRQLFEPASGILASIILLSILPTQPRNCCTSSRSPGPR